MLEMAKLAMTLLGEIAESLREIKSLLKESDRR